MKKIHLIIIFIILITAIGLWYFFIFNQKWRGNEYQEYNNTKYNFSFEYPKSWYSSKLEPEISMMHFRDTVEKSGDGGIPLGAIIEVIVLANYDNLSLEDWIDQSLAQGPIQEILNEDKFTLGHTQFLRKVFAPLPGLAEAEPIIVSYTSFNNEKYIVQINYLGRKPNYTTGMKHFEHLLQSFKIEEKTLNSQDARFVVEEYMKFTLGMIPEAKINYEAAKKLLTPDLAEKFDNPDFIPMTYCIQDGPTDVKITSEVRNEEMNWTDITIEAQYGENWIQMWEFQAVPAEDDSWLINSIKCL